MEEQNLGNVLKKQKLLLWMENTVAHTNNVIICSHTVTTCMHIILLEN